MATAFVFDGDDVQVRVPMSALRLVSDFEAKYYWHPGEVQLWSWELQNCVGLDVDDRHRLT